MPVTGRPAQILVAAGLIVAIVVAACGDDQNAVSTGALRDGFETAQTIWQQEATDAAVKLIDHDRSELAAHGGRLSERFHFDAGPGTRFFFSYALPQILVTDETAVGLYVRANRPGVRIYCRAVLPADVDPDTKAPSFVLVPGTVFDQVDRWQRLELLNMVPEIERQARVLRAASRRPVPLKGAYLDRVVINVLGGPGEAEVFVDDLEIAPVPRALLDDVAKRRAGSTGDARAVGKAGDRAPAPGSGPSAISAVDQVRLIRNLLEKRVSESRFAPWLPTVIDAPGANPVKLRQAGFDVLVVDGTSEPERFRSAVKQGALLMARLSDTSAGDGPDQVRRQIDAQPLNESVVFWHIGDHYGRKREIKDREAELERFRAAIAAIRGTDDRLSHLATATVDGDLPQFARAPSGIDLIGIQPRSWSSIQNPLEVYDYLIQRRLLTYQSNLGSLFWAWLPVSASPEVVRNIWGDDEPPSWGTPPVQPQQVRLMTYLALASGYRGLVYTGDADLTRPAGRAVWIELSFLNFEIDLCESILADNDRAIPWYSLYDPDPLPVPSNAIQLPSKRPPQKKENTPKGDLHAAAISLKDRKGALLLVGDFASGAQFQPGQLATDKVVVTPILPESAQAFQITPGEVKFLKPERVPGGTRLTLEEFDTTALVLCTGDVATYERIRSAVDAIRPQAVGLAIEQAELIHQAVTEVNGRLAADGHPLITDWMVKQRRKTGIEGKPPDVTDLLAQSQEYIKSARAAQERQDYAQAWAEARRALRPLRIVMSGHYANAQGTLKYAVETINGPTKEKAEKDKDEVEKARDKIKNANKVPKYPPVLFAPISCPPCISFYTLPEFYIWSSWMSGRPGYRYGPNRVPSGTFDVPAAVTDAGWTDVSYRVDGLISDIKTVSRIETNANRADKNKPGVDELMPENMKSNRLIKMEVKPEHPEDLDTLMPAFLDFPVAAIRTPRIRMETNNLIRISVLVKRPLPSVPGAGGIIVRDSIGGEQFQFRTSSPLATFHRVVLFRKAPSDGTFTVTLGLAGYGEAYFDDLRVEVVEHEPGSRDNIARARSGGPRTRSPRTPDPRLPAAARVDDSSRRDR
jgi:hypothetical protein